MMQIWKEINAFVLLMSMSHGLHVKDNDLSYYVITDSKHSIEE